ncbi:MAG: hypothetical protein DMF64_14970 [Acidobacteria bacterium]|nr:MAG: hypothetical protein DMF64_14970 [Acidobacteriota bacterium]
MSNWLVAEAESALGGCLVALRRFDEAEPLLTDSYTILKNRRAIQDTYTRLATTRLVNLYQAWGKPERAAQYR